MKILITGGTTWFGQSIVQRILHHGHEVVCFDDNPMPWRLQFDQTVQVWQGCVTSLGALAEVVRREKPDVIVHRQVLYGVETEDRYLRTVHVNIVGALHVFEIAALAGVRRVVYESSIGVYGTQSEEEKHIITEVDAQFHNPEYVFQLTQLSVEFFARRYSQQTSVEIVGTRPSVCHSPLKDQGISRWSNDFVSMPALGKPMQFPFPATQRTSLIWVDDAAEIYARLADQATLKYDMYNSGGYDVSNQELADMVRYFIVDARFSYAESGVQPMPHRVGNDRAREDLGIELKPLPETLVLHANITRKLHGLPPL